MKEYADIDPSRCATRGGGHHQVGCSRVGKREKMREELPEFCLNCISAYAVEGVGAVVLPHHEAWSTLINQ